MKRYQPFFARIFNMHFLLTYLCRARLLARIQESGRSRGNCMKPYLLFVCAAGILATISQAEASVLYGSTSAGGRGELWIVDSTTGAGVQDIGPLNDALAHNYAVTGLAFNPLTGVLYGSTGGT